LIDTLRPVSLPEGVEITLRLAGPVTRARALTKSGGITQADSEQAEFQLRQTEIAVRKARRDVDLTRIAAPFAGVASGF